METTVHLAIRGCVQGVGFRESLRAEAVRLGVCGWVRNRSDGSVEAIVQGSPDGVAALTAWAHQGPAAARVLQVTASAPPPGLDRRYAGFERLPSA